MSVCRDWINTQYPASFKFRPFAVETETLIGGRRVVTHEFPGREWWANEDLGKRANRIQVTAYIYGDDADLKASEFFEACNSEGPGLLTLPLRPPRLAQCIDVASTFKKDELGRFTFELVFVLQPLGLGAVVSLIASANKAQAAAKIAIDASASLFAERFDALPVAAAARGAGATTINLAGRALDTARKTVRMRNAAAYAKAEVRARRIKIDATDLAYAGDRPNRTEANTFIKSQKVLTSSFAPAFIEATGALAKFADPIDMADAMKIVAAFESNSASSNAEADSITDENNLINAAADFVRRVGLMRWAEALTKVKFPSRSKAITARADFATFFETEIETVDDSEVHSALTDAGNATVDYISATAADLPADIKRLLARPLPAAVIAYQLYGKADRDEDIIARNALEHPLHSVEDIVAASK